MEAIKNIVLLISLSSILFSFSARAICVPRDYNHVAPRSSLIPKFTTPSSSPKAPAPKANNPPPKAPISPPQAAPKAPTPPPSVAPEAPVAAPKAGSINDAELSRLCGLTENPPLCMETASPYLKGIPDPISVLKAVMTAANDTLGSAISEAKGFASDPKISPQVKTCISTCLENYESAVDDIAKSFKAIDKKDVGSLNSNLDGALTMIGTCEDTFDENPGIESPMQETDRKLYLMVDNCLAIRNAVKDIITPPVVV